MSHYEQFDRLFEEAKQQYREALDAGRWEDRSLGTLAHRHASWLIATVEHLVKENDLLRSTIKDGSLQELCDWLRANVKKGKLDMSPDAVNALMPYVHAKDRPCQTKR